MLQQTQVDRVIPFYNAFLKTFPSVRSLAAAPLGDVLKAWQGLGYNRRAKMLHRAAQKVVSVHKGAVPCAYEDLVALPGVGEYTAKAIRTFAFNEPEVLIETNVRTVFIHHFFAKKSGVPDTALAPHIESTLDRKNPRDWYAALMDYGAHLKRTMPNPSRQSAHHSTQKAFRGSDREVRGAILRAVSTATSLRTLPFDTKRTEEQAARLVREGLLERRGRGYRLPATSYPQSLKK